MVNKMENLLLFVEIETNTDKVNAGKIELKRCVNFLTKSKPVTHRLNTC